MNTVELNETNFDTEVLKANEPVIVDFWAPWCGPCKMIAPVLDEIAAAREGKTKIAKVNLDENPALAQRFAVQAIPTLLYFEGGQLKDRSVGAVTKREILRRLEDIGAAA